MAAATLDGTTNHGNPNLICTPIKWYQILAFFVTNYFAHAATVKGYPGQPLLDAIVDAVFALLIPTSGIIRGVNAILKCTIRYHSIFGGEDLRMAAKADALCFVVRSKDWTPAMAHGAIVDVTVEPLIGHKSPIRRLGTYLRRSAYMDPENGVELPSIAKLSDPGEVREASLTVTMPPSIKGSYASPPPSTKGSYASPPANFRNIHGHFVLPRGFAFAMLPNTAKVVSHGTAAAAEAVNSTEGNDNGNGRIKLKPTVLAHSYNFAKAIVAIVQVVFAVDTLYRTRGDQLQLYGYAAFGLTVIPYAVMSIVNLLGSVFTPDYPAVYMVSSPEMEEARQCGGEFGGMVGSVVEDLTAGLSVGICGLDSHGRSLMRLGILPRWKEARARLLMEPKPSPMTAISPHEPDTHESLWRIDDTAATDQKPEYVIKVPSFTAMQTLDSSPGSRWFKLTFMFITVYGLPAIPFAVIAGLTSFHPAQSTTAQRVWLMMWLVFGQSVWIGYSRYSGMERGSVFTWKYVRFVLLNFALAVPAIGGFVVVGQMLQSYGHCVEIGS